MAQRRGRGGEALALPELAYVLDDSEPSSGRARSGRQGLSNDYPHVHGVPRQAEAKDQRISITFRWLREPT